MKFEFDEKTHRYYLDGKPLTGVTTILGVIAKPALIGWASNQAVEHIKQNSDIGDFMGIGSDCYVVKTSTLEEARTAHAKKRDKAADVGTLAHKWIEEHIKGKDNPITDDIKPMIDNFLKWEEEVKPKYLETEKRVYSAKNWYAGTLDLMLEIDGEVWLGDIKTGSGIYPEHFFQCAAYQLALQEMGEYPEIKGHIILNLRKDGKMDIKKSISFERDIETFLSALVIYRRLNNQ